MAEYPTTQSEIPESGKSGTYGKSARQSVGQVKEEALQRGKGIAEEQKRSAADTAHRLASALENVASDLEYDQPQFASLFRTSARTLDDFSRTLRDRDAGSLLQQAQDFARRQPALVLGGTIAAGFLLSRVLKSSPYREEESYPGYEKGYGEAYRASSGEAEPYASARREDVTVKTTID